MNSANPLAAASLLVILIASPAIAAGPKKSDLNLVHQGTVAVDSALLRRAPQSAAVLEFFAVARQAFEANPYSRFADLAEIRESARQQGLTHLGGPMLGSLTHAGASVWLRTSRPAEVTVLVRAGDQEHRFGPVASTAAGDLTAVVPVTGLKPATRHPYRVLIDGKPITMPAGAAITTAPEPAGKSRMQIAFGSCFHKTGLWNRPLLDQIRKRGNRAMILLGDGAVDDRESRVGLHRSDYLLRDLSPSWQELAATVPVYAAWDDHDYFNNDLSGIPPKATAADRAAVRTVWSESWNNPAYGLKDQGIFFRTRIGPCDLIMLDTRFFRSKPGQPAAFLGQAQMDWLLDELAACRGPFIILTSGTMWSDAISGGKDSWGAWDPEARERIFGLIEKRRIGGVLLLSGDRHGARVLRIPRPSGFAFHEFELASLGGHAGPPATGSQPDQQLFGRVNQPAFGEFLFDTTPADPTVTMRAVDAGGKEIYQLTLARSQLTPGNLKTHP